MIYPVTLLTPKSATALIIDPKMSIDGQMPEYTYKPAKANPKIYNVLKLLHTHHDVEPIAQTFMKTLKSSQPLEIKKLQEAAVSKEVDYDDSDDSSSSGEEIEDASNEKNFPPGGQQLPKQMSSLNKKKNKPCAEASCAKSKDGNGGKEGENKEESAPQPDIPIELGLAPEDGEEDTDADVDNGYKVTYIDRKTPESFLMLEEQKKTTKRTSSSVVKTLKRERREVEEEPIQLKYHHRHQHHHKRHIITRRHKRNKIQQQQQQQKNKKLQKRYSTKSSGKRGVVSFDKDLLQRAQQLNEKQKLPKSNPEGRIVRPIQTYIRTLSKDINNVMGQAKQVLQSTGQVVHGLKRIIGGASVLSTVANDAVKYGKYFNLDPKNSTLEYLQEQAIVALITAEQSSKEAQEAALIAKSASEKATNIARRMDIAKSGPSQQTVEHLNDMTKTQTSQAEKAARFATIQEDKTKKVSSFINATIKRMVKKMSPLSKVNLIKKLPENPKNYTESKVKSISNETKLTKPATVDPDYADFKEQLSEYAKAATETSQAKNESSKMNSNNTQANTAFKKKEIMQKPVTNLLVHLSPGEYTGFKRSRIETADKTLRDVEYIKRFKSFGKVKDDDHEGKEDVDKDETEVFHARKIIPSESVLNVLKDNNKSPSSVLVNHEKTYDKLRNYNDTSHETKHYSLIDHLKRNITEETQKQLHQSKHQGSGSGDNEDVQNVDLAKFLKAPISVSVHVTSSEQNEAGTSEVSSSEGVEQNVGDPFGFTKIEKRRGAGRSEDDEFIDPFGFNKLQENEQQKYFSKNSKYSNLNFKTSGWD